MQSGFALQRSGVTDRRIDVRSQNKDPQEEHILVESEAMRCLINLSDGIKAFNFNSYHCEVINQDFGEELVAARNC